MKFWPPMDYVDLTGQPRGIGVDFIALFNKRLNGSLEIVQDEWPVLLEKLQKGEIEALMDITPTEQRELEFKFTSPYVVVPHVIFARKDGPYYSNLADLSGKTVSLEQGFYIEREIRQKYPDITIKSYAKTSDALDAALKGEADAYVGNRAVATYIIRNELIENLQQQGKLKGTASVNAIAVREDNPLLHQILQRTLDSLSLAEQQAITRDWIEDPQRKMQLTADERAWLKAHPVIRVAADVGFPPIEYVGKDDRFSGLAMDYLKELSSTLGVSFDTSSRLDWNSSVKKVANRELDIFSAAASTVQRKEIAIFTDPYIRLPQVIFSLDSVPYIDGLSGLKGKKVAVVRGYAVTDHLKAGNWDVELLEVKDVHEGLDLLQAREVDAYIGSILITSYAMREKGLTNIRVAGQTPFKNGLAMGVRKDWPEFAIILQKALNSIPAEKHQQLLQKWIGLKIEPAINYTLILQLAAAGVVLLLLFFAWNAYLQKRMEVQRKRYRLLQEQLRQSQKMDAVGQLTGGIAHDFNNILAIILGNLELLHESLDVQKDDKAAGRIEAAFVGARRGAELTRKLLNFSRRDREGTKRICINDFVRNVEDLLGKSLTVAIDIECHLAEDLWQVDADPGDLQDAIVNLSINARDAMPDGGLLIFETMNKVLDTDYVKLNPQGRPGEYVMLSVSDTGDGMPASVRDRVFEPFFTTKSVGKGTGLGLSMVYGFVKRSHGHMEIYSEVGEGTTFRLYLPKAVKERRKQSRAVGKRISLPRGSETVLVVDDEDHLTHIAVSYLENLGYKTIAARGPKEALEILNGAMAPVDLLFSDVVMPGGMDGFELARKAREVIPGLKVLLTSGFTKKREKIGRSDTQEQAALARTLLSKPYSREELAIAVRSALDNSQEPEAEVQKA